MRFSRTRRMGGTGGDENFDLNITPIIDCFTVLIAFVLVATSIASISIMESEVSAQNTPSTQEPQSSVSITIRPDHAIDLAFVAGPNESARVRERFRSPIRIPARGTAGPDYDLFLQRLAFIKGEWPSLKSAVLTADSSVAYKDVIKSMEIARNAFSAIALGGLE